MNNTTIDNATFSVRVTKKAQDALANGEESTLTYSPGYTSEVSSLNLTFDVVGPIGSPILKLRGLFPRLFSIEVAELAKTLSNSAFNEQINEILYSDESTYSALKSYTARWFTPR